ncbi:hypothetical protein [Ramlibacter pallidus]|uniref:Uncharacterized protein n=1 Tax=Ramlibacter pallidus TaxID=2780087 RepID=A0ABR9S2M9_9BURK|nr:hypothetical protein [Ramlibacter pallidus]MBE7367322.1 hypothetical protein [Ramlibacter pallidus]
MNAPRERKYVVAAKAVNRRTTPRAPAPPAPVARERAAATQARRRVGAPLAELLRTRADARRRVSALAVAGGMVAAGSGIALFLGWLQGSVILGGLGALGAGAGLLAVRSSGGRAAGRQDEGPQAPLLDEPAMRSFDDAMARVAPELPADAAQQLSDVKQLVVRIARHPAASGADEHFTLEDRMYVVECVRRYVPDALQAYLSVPRAQRSVEVAEGRTAQAVLSGQLALLRTALQEREQKLARSAAEALLRQERFLKSKR